VVFNSPGANSEAVKELAICAMLLCSRDLLGGIDWVKSIADKGDEVAAMVEKGKSAFVGPEIKGKTLGVIGLGAVGAKIAAAATNLGMKVYGYDPYISVDAAWNLSSSVIHATDLDTIYKNADYISIHVPYLESTHHMLSKEAFYKMKNGVRILNLARGELVSDDDILDAIEAGKVACYVTDFPNGKLAGKNKVIAIPHLGASTPESEDNCAYMAAREIIEYVENGNITNSVNMPTANMPRTGDNRICIIHKNIPEMITKISTIVSSKGLNIENMVNAGAKNRKYAYTMLDVATDVDDSIAEEFKAIDGIIRVRVLK
ncbi:MAG: phosphoglycerate dehydrogenase, partial [Oscillospiraceae bacterium]|nr:phosphoglycerate dehydrogenase [Oscillospiraceae bacterium]